MRARCYEDKSSTPQHRGAETLPRLSSARKQGVRAHYRRARLRGFSVRDSIQLVALSASVRILQRRAS